MSFALGQRELGATPLREVVTVVSVLRTVDCIAFMMRVIGTLAKNGSSVTIMSFEATPRKTKTQPNRLKKKKKKE